MWKRSAQVLTAWLVPLLIIALVTFAIHRAFAAQPSGLPSRPTFQAVGVAVPPSVLWGAGIAHVDLNGNSALISNDTVGDIALVSNLYFDGSNWRFKSTGYGSLLNINDSSNNNFYFYSAGAGTAGAVATLTQHSVCYSDGTNCPAAPHAWGIIIGTSGGCTVSLGYNIASCSRENTGAYDLTFTTGAFASYVICTATPTATQHMADFIRNTTTDATVELSTSGGYADGTVVLNCVGV